MFNDTSGVYSARPVIEVNGEIQDQLGESLLSLTVTAAVMATRDSMRSGRNENRVPGSRWRSSSTSTSSNQR